MRSAFRAGCQLLLGSLFVFCLFAPIVVAAELPTVVEVSDEVPSVFVPVELDSDGVLHVQFGSGVSCDDFNAGYPYVLDAFLRVRDSSGVVVAQDDDGDHSEQNCLGAKVHVELVAGSYVVEFTRFGSTQGEGVVVWGELLAATTTTSSSTTTTSTLTTTTSTSTTTTTLVPSTITSTTTTTTTSLPPTTTVLSTTTSTLLPTTTSSSTTTVPPTTTTTTLAPTTTTTLAPTTTTTLAPTTTSTTTTTLPATTTSSSSTTSSTTTAAPILTTTLPAAVTVTNPPAPPIDATEAEKQLFEEQVNIYGSDDYIEYVPAGSTISVGQRRTIVAATVVISASPVMPTRRRNR